VLFLIEGIAALLYEFASSVPLPADVSPTALPVLLPSSPAQLISVPSGSSPEFFLLNFWSISPYCYLSFYRSCGTELLITVAKFCRFHIMHQKMQKLPARSEDDFKSVTDWWDRLDSNRKRKERYHEVGISAVPLEWGSSNETVVIPNPIQHVFWKQIVKGKFLNAIFDCLLKCTN